MIIRNKYISIIALVIWMGIIFYMSGQVATTSSGMSSFFVEPIKPYAPDFSEDAITFIVRKSAHIFMYFVLGMLVFNVLRQYIHNNNKLVIFSIIFAFIYAITDEIHQMFVPERSAEPRDVLLDTLGASLGVALYLLIIRLKAKKAVNNG